MLTLITVPNVEIIHLPSGDPAPKTKYEPLHKRKQHLYQCQNLGFTSHFL